MLRIQNIIYEEVLTSPGCTYSDGACDVLLSTVPCFVAHLWYKYDEPKKNNTSRKAIDTLTPVVGGFSYI